MLASQYVWAWWTSYRIWSEERKKKKNWKNIWHIRNDDKLCLVEFYFVYFVFASLNSIFLFSSESWYSIWNIRRWDYALIFIYCRFKRVKENKTNSIGRHNWNGKSIDWMSQSLIRHNTNDQRKGKQKSRKIETTNFH